MRNVILNLFLVTSLLLAIFVFFSSYDVLANRSSGCTATCLDSGQGIACFGDGCFCTNGHCGGIASCSCNDFWAAIACSPCN